MKPTALPVRRPTCESIKRFFHSSEKRHLLITGARGAGKSTLLARLRADGPEMAGLETRVLPGERVLLQSGAQTLTIGRFDPNAAGAENRMRPLPALDGEAAAWVDALTAAPGDFVALDEIGYLETSSPAYCRALLRLFAKKRVLAVVRKQELPFLTALKSRADVCLLDLDQPYGRMGCVIMASGEGRRFGGNKLLADFAGRPLLQGVLDATAELFARRVVVTRHEEVAALCRQQNIETILHSLPERSDTVRLGVNALARDTDGCLFCPGDQPLLRRETVETMVLWAAFLAARAADGGEILRPVCGAQCGAPLFFPAAYYPALGQLPPGRGGSFLAQKNPERVRFVPVREINELQDVDTRQDLARLLNRPEP